MQKSETSFSFIVSPQQAGLRLDKFLTAQMEGVTRSALGRLIHEGFVYVDQRAYKAGYRVRTGETITVAVPPRTEHQFGPEQVDFEILHEDDDILVLVKPPGLVVHPAAGHSSGTLAHGLLFHCDTLPGIDEQRPGIVHRLDKDTSGIMLVAKSEIALRKLAEDFRHRNIEKIYHAVLLRCPREETGRVVKPIGRHPVKRKKMAVRPISGRYAATRYRVVERFENGMCFAELNLETGRTHQIRVHMANLGCPVAGDALYGGQVPDSSSYRPARQMLHASTLIFSHPVSKEKVKFTAPLWKDMQQMVDNFHSIATGGK